jgi:hypothetical protein
MSPVALTHVHQSQILGLTFTTKLTVVGVRVPLDRVVARHSEAFAELRRPGMTWWDAVAATAGEIWDISLVKRPRSTLKKYPILSWPYYPSCASLTESSLVKTLSTFARTQAPTSRARAASILLIGGIGAGLSASSFRSTCLHITRPPSAARSRGARSSHHPPPCPTLGAHRSGSHRRPDGGASDTIKQRRLAIAGPSLSELGCGENYAATASLP